MTEGRIKRAWKSGSVKGYNGDGISVTATYRLEPGAQAPESVDLRFFDNSETPDGPFSRLRSFPLAEKDWADIPLPDPEGAFGEGLNEGFSIRGQIRLEETAKGHFLRLRFHWGDEQVHAEEGYIMQLSESGA